MNKLFFSLVACFTFVIPKVTMACAVCYGASDDPMTKGVEAGVIALLGILAPVLGGIIFFGVNMNKRAKMVSQKAISLDLKKDSVSLELKGMKGLVD
ncbi:MAG: hypothetical protein DWQ06_12060 [Calditrichaeota bacterium]|nr:MAG: hypothetical protein DWQ06_12060 [Calditrichota bacterium]